MCLGVTIKYWNFMIINYGNRHRIRHARQLIRGHAHTQDAKEINLTLVVNPGEACGHLANKSAIEVLNIENLKALVIDKVRPGECLWK
jgi:predicted phosphodiesterase